MLERKDLAAEAQRALCQQADLRKAVEHHAGRSDALDLLHHEPDGLAEFEVGRVEDRLLALGIQAEFGRNQLEDFDAVDIPAMRVRDVDKFIATFAERDVKAALALVLPLHQELQSKSRLACSRFALNQVRPVRSKTATKNVIECRKPGAHRPRILQQFGRTATLVHAHSLRAWAA